LKRAKVKMEYEREGGDSDFGILKGMWIGVGGGGGGFGFFGGWTQLFNFI